MSNADIQQRLLRAHHGKVAVRLQGDSKRPAVLMTHSILSSGLMWNAQAAFLAAQGWHVVRIDTTGHGDSPVPTAPMITMDGLAADTIAVLDALGIAQAHYIGLSLGGMSGFGLGIHHAPRLLSLVLCSARADAPPEIAAPWDERIATAEQNQSCAPLSTPTIERWFGKAFMSANPETADCFEDIASATSVEGFVGCARAIQGLDYLAGSGRISAPTTLIVGSNDGVLPEAMRDLNQRIDGSVLETIAGAGHLPNVDQPAAFNTVLLRHFDRIRK